MILKVYKPVLSEVSFCEKNIIIYYESIVVKRTIHVYKELQFKRAELILNVQLVLKNLRSQYTFSLNKK